MLLLEEFPFLVVLVVSCCVTQTDLKLLIFLPQPPKWENVLNVATTLDFLITVCLTH